MLVEILACPRTKSPLVLRDEVLTSVEGATYAVSNGVPILTTSATPPEPHEGPLSVWSGYEPAIDFMLSSIPRSEPIVDLGSGNRDIDDPRIIRVDVTQTPHVDVVADAHDLPFKDNSIGALYATAVFEHLHSPWIAAQEVWRVLKPGGYALVDCNFVFPYHGYPAVYFNASIEGMRRIFRDFTELEALVAPWQTPAFAVDAVLREYINLLRRDTAAAAPLIQAIDHVLSFPLKEFDREIAKDDAHRLAAAVSFIGLKQLHGNETIIPDSVMRAWHHDPTLGAKYPNPFALIDFKNQRLDSLLHWSQSESMALDSVSDHYRSLIEFRKA